MNYKISGAEYRDIYRKKLVSPEEAARKVKSGDWVEYAFGVCAANEFDRALSERKDDLADVNIRCDIGAWPHYTSDADPEGKHFHWNSWHVGGLDRKYYSKGLLSYIPMKFHEKPFMVRNNCVPDNVFVAQVSPMDRHGFFSWGAGAPASMAGAETADTVILEINTKIPRVLGGGQEHVHISQVDYIIEGNNPELPVIPEAVPSDDEKKIAGYIMEGLYDGCCLQLGIGGIPNAVGKMIAQSDLHDLGVYTEMYVDAYLEMTRAGKITGSRKNFDRFKQVFSFAMGSRDLYDFIDDNPGIAAYSVDYTNDPKVVSRLDDFVSINACIEVDLFGQICAESVGTKHISGTGGQLDFVEGAYKSRNGQSYVCMTSTFTGSDGNKVSRIKPILTPGAIVTDPRTATHMIVTEYGIADMKGKSTWERAEALISIAHPDFRDELVKEAESMKIWRKVNR